MQIFALLFFSNQMSKI